MSVWFIILLINLVRKAVSLKPQLIQLSKNINQSFVGGSKESMWFILLYFTFLAAGRERERNEGRV